MTYSSLESLPPIDALRAAIAAAHHGSFSAAADALGTTHAAISRRVALAEDWAGEPLFLRQARGVVLTLAGQRVLSQVESALAQLAAAGPRARAALPLPVVRLACTPAFARFWLLPRLATLEAADPELRIQLLADLHQSRLDDGSADLLIRYGRGQWPGAQALRLGEQPLVAVLTPALAAAFGLDSAATPEALMRCPLLHDGDASNWRSWASAQSLGWRAKPDDREMGSYALAIDAACAGLGVALWRPALHPLPAGLRVFEASQALSRNSYYLLSQGWPAHAPAARLARRLQQMLVTD